jgi:hypothetical protein
MTASISHSTTAIEQIDSKGKNISVLVKSNIITQKTERERVGEALTLMTLSSSA